MQLTIQLPHDVESIPAARRALDDVRAGLDDLTLRNARLLVSELVTNVIRHVEPAPSGDPIELVVDRSDERLRVEVVDPGAGFEPQPAPSRREASSGWGLSILAQTASRWGVDTEPCSRVWFELDSRSTASPDAPSPQPTAG